jgi:hypothetical protein
MSHGNWAKPGLEKGWVFFLTRLGGARFFDVDWNGGLLPLEPEFRPGGIVFDRTLLEEPKDKEITFVVKGGPIINDATVEDAKFAGIEKIAEIKTVSNGEPGPGPKGNS